MLRRIQNDVHTKHMGCGQYIRWNVEDIAHKKEANGYIVQEVQWETIRDGESIKCHYFEAWEIINGQVNDTVNISYDDGFCVGRLVSEEIYDFDDEIIESLGHCGSDKWQATVYWVDKDEELFHIISNWPSNEVKKANGLRSVWATKDTCQLFKLKSGREREPFMHEWDLRSEENIKDAFRDYVFAQSAIYLSDKKKLAIDKFESYMSSLPPQYSHLREGILEEWESLQKAHKQTSEEEN